MGYLGVKITEGRVVVPNIMKPMRMHSKISARFHEKICLQVPPRIWSTMPLMLAAWTFLDNTTMRRHDSRVVWYASSTTRMPTTKPH